MKSCRSQGLAPGFLVAWLSCKLTFSLVQVAWKAVFLGPVVFQWRHVQLSAGCWCVHTYPLESQSQSGGSRGVHWVRRPHLLPGFDLMCPPWPLLCLILVSPAFVGKVSRINSPSVEEWLREARPLGVSRWYCERLKAAAAMFDFQLHLQFHVCPCLP
jgi:hypothetical protein